MLVQNAFTLYERRHTQGSSSSSTLGPVGRLVSKGGRSPENFVGPVFMQFFT